MRYITSITLGLASQTLALDNGLALTPPMGFISWQRFGAEVDCKTYPKTCISETLYMEIADAMVSTGLRDVGYKYINIDDNWSTDDRRRHGDGTLAADPVRFPHGMKALADYIHSKGLLFGTYTDVGETTCQGYPSLERPIGQQGGPPGSSSWHPFFEKDIDMFLDWGIDSLKVDGCNAKGDYAKLYPAMSELIQSKIRARKAARGELHVGGQASLGPDQVDTSPSTVGEVLLTCSWPAYIQKRAETNAVMGALIKHCNLWRNAGDISDNWDSVKSIVNWWARKSPLDIMVRSAGPGHWNDPDMLIIGDKGLSPSQERAQFALWAIFAAPLFISADVRVMAKERPDSLAVLKNEKVIAVNQDKWGQQGWVVYDEPKGDGMRVWMRPLSSLNPSETIKAAVLFENRRDAFNARAFQFDLRNLGWMTPIGSAPIEYTADDCHSDRVVTGTISNGFSVMVDVNSVEMFVFTTSRSAAPAGRGEKWWLPEIKKKEKSALFELLPTDLVNLFSN